MHAAVPALLLNGSSGCATGHCERIVHGQHVLPLFAVHATRSKIVKMETDGHSRVINKRKLGPGVWILDRLKIFNFYPSKS